MWPFTQLFEDPIRLSRHPLPGKWPDDASDVSRSDVSKAEDGLNHDILTGNSHTTIYYCAMAVFRAISAALHYICLSIEAWIGIGACSACDNLRATLVATVEQLNIARKTCGDLRLANNDLRVECATTGRMMHDIFRKLIMTSKYADEMLEDSVRVEGELFRQEPELIRLRNELNSMGSQIKALRALDDANPVRASDTEAWHRCRRLEEGREVLQRKLDTANARNAELFYENEEMSRKLRLAKKDANSTVASTKAKEDIEWYEAKTIQQQECIFELRRLLGLSRWAKWEMLELHKIEIQRVRDECDASIETIHTEHEEQLAAIVDQVNETYRQKFAEWKKSKMKAVEEARSYSALENEDRVHEAVMERLEVRRLETVAHLTKWEREWKEKVAVLKKETKNLRSEMLEMRDFMDAEIEQAVAHRLSSENGLEQTKLVNELQTKIDNIEFQRKDDQRVYRERLQEAVIEGWRLSSDEKVQELLEAFDQMKEELIVSQQTQNSLMEQVAAFRETEVEAYQAHDDAVELRQIVAENDKLIERQKREIDTLSAELSVLRPTLEKVVAAQDATMEANERHQQDLRVARNQVATLVDQVSELEDHVESLQMAHGEAQKMHKILLDAEMRKTREAVAALNDTRAMLSPIQEEQMTDVSSDESSEGDDTFTQQLFARLSSKYATTRPSLAFCVDQIQQCSTPKTKTLMPARNPEAVAPINNHQSQERLPLQAADGRLNRPRLLAAPSIPHGTLAEHWDRTQSDFVSPSPTWAEI